MSDFMDEYTAEELLNHEKQIYCPTPEELAEYARKYPDRFIFDSPLLLSPDRKIMYGYSAKGLKELVIPDEVEIYDNLCSHTTDEENEYYVTIGLNLRSIVDTYDSFGLHVSAYFLSYKFNYKNGESYTNRFFSERNGVLYDKSGETLILYPSGKTTTGFELQLNYEKSFFALPVGTKVIKENAFRMLLLPDTLVIPDTVEIIEKGAFMEEYEKGIYMRKQEVLKRSIILPERFSDVIDDAWKRESHERPNIIYY